MTYWHISRKGLTVAQIAHTSDSARSEEENYTGFVGLIIDNTERDAQEAERTMLTTLVQRSPNLIAVATLAGSIVFLNRAGQEKCGVDGEEQVSRTHILDYFADEEQARVRDEVIPSLLELGQLTIEVSAKNLKTGRTFPALWTAFVIYDRNTKEPALLAAIVKDITEQHENRSVLQKAFSENELLLEENKALQERLRRDNISLQEINQALQGELAAIQKTTFEKIVGSSPGLRRTLNKVA